jgi:hypothetical protein
MGAAGAVGSYAAATAVGWGAGVVGGPGVVIGAYEAEEGAANYVTTAKAIGASALNLPSWLWNALNYAGETWTANAAFLQMSIWRGQQFFLSGGRGDTLLLELQYLASRGIYPINLTLDVPKP